MQLIPSLLRRRMSLCCAGVLDIRPSCHCPATGRQILGTFSCSSITRMSSTGRAPIDVIEFLDRLKNYEKVGVPQGAGTDTADGFDHHRMRRLLASLGDPLSHYPVVHIAGTKGKGSTAAFISSILRAEGYSVGCYTSPHIQTIHERISAGKSQKPLSPTAFQKLFQDSQETLETAIAAEKGSLSYFEVLTALAFKYFAHIHVDIAVIEAGLGGARDATNVILPAGLAVAVITNVGEEHLSALGGSLRSIAFAKAGIIKEGRPVVLGGPLNSEIEQIMYEVAASKNAMAIPAYGQGVRYLMSKAQLEEDSTYQCCDISINRTCSNDNLHEWKFEKSVRLQLIGQHQLDNAITALCTVMSLRDQGWRVSDAAILSGLEHAFMPGRFHVLSKQQTTSLGCLHSRVVLDGAHTGGSAKALADTLRMVFPSNPLAIVVAMASDKNHYEFGMQLLTYAAPKVVVTTETPVAGGYMRATSPSLLAERWIQAARDQGLEVANLQNVEETCGEIQHNCGNVLGNVEYASITIYQSKSVLYAIKKASELLLENTQQIGVVCVTGSLHLVSQVLSSVGSDSPQ